VFQYVINKIQSLASTLSHSRDNITYILAANSVINVIMSDLYECFDTSTVMYWTTTLQTSLSMGGKALSVLCRHYHHFNRYINPTGLKARHLQLMPHTDSDYCLFKPRKNDWHFSQLLQSKILYKHIKLYLWRINYLQLVWLFTGCFKIRIPSNLTNTEFRLLTVYNHASGNL
jgi:hypothetical protein